MQAFGKVRTKVQAFEKSASKSASLPKKCRQKCKPSKKSCKELHSWLITWTLWSRFVRGTPELPERNLEHLRCSWLQAQSEGDKGTIWELDILPAASPEGDRATTTRYQSVNRKFSWRQAQSEATTAIWELEIFLGGGPGQKATGLQLQSGNLKFSWRQAKSQSQGHRATTAIWELEIFWWQAQLEGDRATTAIWELEIFAGMPSWKATGLQLQSGNSRFFWRQAQLEGDRATTAIWELEIFWWRAQ